MGNGAIRMTTQELLERAKAAKGAMALADTDTKNRALLAMAAALESRGEDILAANALDLEGARGTVSEVMLDRLALSPPGWPVWRRASGRWQPSPIRWGLSWAGWSGPTGW